ncbi:trypsin-like peptidase domain-containing protein [Streptomyces gamaensis]|uniref:Trypsin-like peptidase domain-containing protein n=1 Tax=Streptomyces gamaensis TaxID=1763542 RepID=A0ABW0Z2W9_9ACTN
MGDTAGGPVTDGAGIVRGGVNGPAFSPPWVLRISDRGGFVLGAGILLCTDTVLTCAHVIDGAGEEVVAEHLWDPVWQSPARYVKGSWVPARADCGDLALLTLTEPRTASEGAPLHRLVPSYGRAVRMCGFPRSLRDGVWFGAGIAGPAGPRGEWVQLDPGRQEHTVRPGFSGTAVIDNATGYVLGMVVSRYDDHPDAPYGPPLRLSYMIPVGTIARYLPHIDPYVTGEPCNSLPVVPESARVDGEFARFLADWFRAAEGTRPVEAVVVRKTDTERSAALSRAVALADREGGASAAGPGFRATGAAPFPPASGAAARGRGPERGHGTEAPGTGHDAPGTGRHGVPGVPADNGPPGGAGCATDPPSSTRAPAGAPAPPDRNRARAAGHTPDAPSPRNSTGTARAGHRAPGDAVTAGDGPHGTPGGTVPDPAAPDGTVPPLGSVDLALDVSGVTVAGLAWRAADRLGFRGGGGEAVQWLGRARSVPLTIVAEGVDHAERPAALVEFTGVLAARGARLLLVFRSPASPILELAKRMADPRNDDPVARLDRVRDRIEHVAARERTARDRIALIAPPQPVPKEAAGLRLDLIRLREAAARQDERLPVLLEAFEKAVEKGLVGAEEAIGRAETDIARRDELRGRLDAYFALAAAHGLTEDKDIAGLYRAAHELLYRAPCELAEAERAVAEFLRAVRARTHRPRPRRRGDELP